MSHLRTFILATTVALALVPQAVRAADLLPPPPMVEAPLRGTIVADQDSGFYLRGDVGVGASQISQSSSTFNAAGASVPGFAYNNVSLGDSVFLGAGVGYKFNNWFRADVTGEYRTSAQYRATASYQDGGNVSNPPTGSYCGGSLPLTRCYDTYSGAVASTVFLANGYVDIGSWYGLTPYVGVGVGLAHHSIAPWFDQSIGNQGGGFSRANSRTNLAWAGMAGIDYKVNRNLTLELGYRYLDMGQVTGGVIQCQPSQNAGCPLEFQKFRLASSDFHLGMRWLLADAFGSSEVVEASALPSSHYARRASGCGSCQAQVAGDAQVLGAPARHF